MSRIIQEYVENSNEPIPIVVLSKFLRKINNRRISDEERLIYQYESQKQICSLVTILNSHLLNPQIHKIILQNKNHRINIIIKKMSTSLKRDKNYNEIFLDLFTINSRLLDSSTIKEVWEILEQNKEKLKFNSLSEMYSHLLTTFLDYELIFENNQHSYKPKSRQRHSTGTYYTPMPLARKLAEKAVKERVLAICAEKSIPISDIEDLKKNSLKNKKKILRELKTTRILDPCCGTGNILIATIESILDFVIEIEKTQNEIQTRKKILDILIPHIFGIDTNPLSVLLVKIILLNVFGVIPINKHFACGNFLNKSTNLKKKNKRLLSWDYSLVEDILNLEEDKQFQMIITNPPWERIRLMEREFFSANEFDIATAETSHLRNQLKIKLNKIVTDNLKNVKDEHEEFTRFIKDSNKFPLSSQGELNLYSLFVEQSYNIISKDGVCGFIIPSGFMTDYSTRHLFWHIFSSGKLASSHDFENRMKIFPAIDGRMRFSLVSIRKNKVNAEAKFSFFSKNIHDLEDKSKHLLLKPTDILKLNPTSKTCPLVRTKKDLQILKKIHSTFPILEKQLELWDIKYLRMFDMSLDSKSFVKTEKIPTQTISKFRKLYEGKMISMYNHRSSSSFTVDGNFRRPGAATKSSLEELQNKDFSVKSRFCINEEEIKKRVTGYNYKWFLAFKDITSATNERTMISSVLPYSGVTNKLPLLLANNSTKEVACLMANLNSYVYDFSCRQKIGNITLNWFIVKQIPVIPSFVYHHSTISKIKLIDWISKRVGMLTYNANDLEEWGKELGFQQPFAYDTEDRRKIQVDLDALYFTMYDMSYAQISHILDSFPIVKKKEEMKFGRYLIKDEILERANELKDELELTLDNFSNVFV